MSGSSRIGIIGGAGWLGGAIARALLETGVVRADELALSYRRQKPTDLPEAFWTTDSQELADRSDVIIVSVRPEDWPAIDVDARGKLIVSVMAGITLSALCERHSTDRVVRTLPNAAADVTMSYTPWIASPSVTKDDRRAVRSIFQACGVQDEVADESQIDFFTGLAGSGPAFPALLGAAMIEEAVGYGIPRDMARRAVNTVLIGTGRMLEKRKQCPADIVETFLGYRGTTAAAIQAMRAAEFDLAIAKGLSAAFLKSVSMGDAP